MGRNDIISVIGVPPRGAQTPGRQDARQINARCPSLILRSVLPGDEDALVYLRQLPFDVSHRAA